MKKVFLFSLLLFLCSLFISPSSVDAVTFTRRVFLQNTTSTSVEFRWVTDTQEQLTVKYGTSPSYGSQVASDTATNCGGQTCTGGNNNHAKITGLSANTKYYYQIVTPGGSALTPAGDTNYYFKTAPPTGTTAPFSFVIWGDSGNSGTSQKNVAKQVAARNPDLAFIAGDIAYGYTTDFAGNNSKYFNIYSDTAAGQNSMRFTPYYVTCGNHEASCPTVVADHSMPGGGNMGNGVESTYAFDYGNAHFVALNSNSSYALSDPQMVWARNNIQSSNQAWKINFWHHNYWSSGSHSTITAREPLVRLSNDAGADLAIWGHSHVFERWNRDTTYPNLQLYTIGNGGQRSSSSCTSSSPGPGCAAKSSGEAGFLYAQVNGNQMTIQYITENGNVADSITLNSGGGGPTSPPTSPSPTSIIPPSRTPTPGGFGTPTPTRTPIPTQPQASPTTSISCPLKPQGDANCDGRISLIDFEVWRREFTGMASSINADYNGDGRVTLADFEAWRRAFTGGVVNLPTSTPVVFFSPTPGQFNPTSTPSHGVPTSTPQTGELSITICDPGSGPFSANITNPYFPQPVGRVKIIESPTLKSQYTVLNQTHLVAGVATRPVEHREWQNGQLIEISLDYYVQAPDGTVCYFGEDVDVYSGGQIVGHSGAWLAGVGQNKPGIMMPAQPAVGQSYYQEWAPGIATDHAVHVAMNQSYTTPAGTFTNVLFVNETPPGTKYYAPGVGLIYDDGTVLTSY